MLKNKITAEDVVCLLNELLDIDSIATKKLIEHRVSCNKNVVNHPYIQVNCDDSKNPKVGLLGFLNGLFGVNENGAGCIVVKYTDADCNNIIHFTVNKS